MIFPVVVRFSDGQIQAALVGVPDVSAAASTREQALAALESVIVQRLGKGELVALEIRHGLEGAKKEGVKAFFQELTEEGAKIKDALTVKQWLTKVDIATRAFLPEEEMNFFWNHFFNRKQAVTLDDRDGCLTWLKAMCLKHCDL